MGPGAPGTLGTPGTPGAFGALGAPGTCGTLGPAGSSAPQALHAVAVAGQLAPHFGHFFPVSALGGLKHIVDLLSMVALGLDGADVVLHGLDALVAGAAEEHDLQLRAAFAVDLEHVAVGVF